LIELKAGPTAMPLSSKGIGRRLAPWALIERRAAFRAGFGARRTAAQRPTAIMGFCACFALLSTHSYERARGWKSLK
jgi:hypothetical protein